VSRSRPTFEEKVAFLRRPSTYGRKEGAVQCIQTHFAAVFLVGRHAYKIKKPLRHRQMDYRTLAARRRGCLEEVRLNRRCASSVYRGVIPLTVCDGAMSLGGKGAVVDWLISMRRLPTPRMLDTALTCGGCTSKEIDAIVSALVGFYDRAPCHPLSGSSYLARLKRDIVANRRELARHGDWLMQDLAQAVCDAQLNALASLAPALATRGARLTDGHGDLRAEHVFLGPPVAFIDSLEFDAKLRHLDPAEEVALLALEIERLGHPRLARRLIDRFCGRIQWDLPDAAFAFYMSHRASTRAKLAAWHLDDPQFPDAAPWIARTESLLGDALRYAQPRAALVADGGPAMKQRSERRTGQHPADSLGKERGHMEFF
jgi:aminoglycoside phosphotransferase family enzyme